MKTIADKMTRALLLAVVMLCSFAATAAAADVVTPDDGALLDLARPMLDAVLSGQWALAAAGALVLCVALARRYGVERWPWLGTDPGGAVLVILGAFGGAVSVALAAGAAVSTGLMWSALGIALSAAGGYSLIKKLVLPVLSKVLPSWAINVIAWIFESKQSPPPGISGVIGDPRDVP